MRRFQASLEAKHPHAVQEVRVTGRKISLFNVTLEDNMSEERPDDGRLAPGGKVYPVGGGTAGASTEGQVLQAAGAPPPPHTHTSPLMQGRL